jgi:hypothetical protein
MIYVYTETNFILELAYLQEQHASCQHLSGWPKRAEPRGDPRAAGELLPRHPALLPPWWRSALRRPRPYWWRSRPAQIPK